MQNLSPKAEPIVWANVAALIVAALVSYGVPISDPLAALLAVVLPFALANVWARYQVFAPDTHAADLDRVAAQAREEGRIAGVRSAASGVRTGPGVVRGVSRFHRTEPPGQ